MVRADSGPIYLDACATTPLRPGVQQRMLDVQNQAWGNPSSLHSFGIAAAEALERKRVEIGALLGADANDVLITSGATESIHLGIRGLASSFAPGRIVISAVEHPAVTAAAHALTPLGWQVATAPVDSEGILQLDRFEELLHPPTRLVSVIWGQSEVGTLQPLQTIGALCRRYGIPFHTDATQVISQALPDWNTLPVDLLSASAHKCGGPRGVGLLLIRRAWKQQLTALLTGGGQENNLRSGTESVVLVAGMAEALAQIQRCDVDGLPDSGDGIRRIRDELELQLCRTVGVATLGQPQQRLPHHLALMLRDRSGKPLSGRRMVRVLDQEGLAVSSGSACSSGRDTDSSVLSAMRMPKEMRRSGLRLSLGFWNSSNQIGSIVERFERAMQVCSE
ncbi:cysteine desulfurase family protein [Synechococcus sp. W2B2]|uniref:cysteine desulfurase family protein n=1 Tax=unclassified Synechococcus TaxID=2626047 RepID=UPI00006B0C48|nr:cysteine desulfurase family protein [Synechococcus sp. WH 7805]EAR18699.1 possible cysteine desulfurase (class-V aminotransferase family) protein [Synechococcus sp. WH 7805]